MAYDDVITRNDDGELAVRTVSVSEGNAPTNYDDVMTRDENGNLAVRVIGNGGGGGGGSSKSVPQYETMPTATSANLGVIAQYKGETDETYTNGYFYKSELTDVTPSEISIEQYQGLGVVPSVDKDTFETQITTTGTYDFTYNGSSWSLDGSPVNIANYGITYTEEPEILTTPNVSSGVEDVYTNSETFASYVGQSGTYTFTYNGSGWELDGNVVDLSDYGITVLDLPTQYSAYQSYGGGSPWSLGDISVDIDTFLGAVSNEIGTYQFNYVSDHWELFDSENPTTVDITDYGISFNGEPNQTAYVEYEQGSGSSNLELEINEQTFVQNTSGDEYYYVESSFTYDGTDWYRDGDFDNPINLADYGITIRSGTPQAGDDIIVRYIPEYTIPYDGDEIVVEVAQLGGAESGDTITVEYEKGLDAGEVLRVDYTEESSEYNWVQTDVQPAGAAGIEWAGSWDKPANEYRYDSIRPLYSVPELADGHYEFYVQNVFSHNRSYYPRTFKLDFIIQTAGWGRVVSGKATWVLDGSSFFDINGLDEGLNTSMAVYMFNNNSVDTIVTSQAAWVSGVRYTADSVPNCFKWSNIKNVDTGEEIPVEISVDSGSYSPSGTQLSGEIRLTESVMFPPEPSRYFASSFEFDDSQQYFTIDGIATDSDYETMQYFVNGSMSDGSEFSSVLTQNSNANGYDIKITKATGNFADSQFGTSGNNFLLFLNTPSGESGTGTFRVASSGSNNEPTIYPAWGFDDSTFEPIGIQTVGYDVLKENYGTIAQYLGETNANYTNGYFYKASGTRTVTPSSISFTETTSTGATFTCPDADAFISTLASLMGWSPQDVIYNMAQGNNNFSLYTDDGNDYWLAWDNVGWGANYLTTGISSLLTISPMPQIGDPISFEIDYTPESITITNGHWEQVDVQPSSSQTSFAVTLPVADWVNDEQTVSAVGVDSNSVVFIGAAPTSVTEYNTCGVICTAQGTDSLTFTCTTTPANDLTVNVLIM